MTVVLKAACALKQLSLPFSGSKMALKSSYLLFYPKQPYFCQAGWKRGIKHSLVSCCVILKSFVLLSLKSVSEADIAHSPYMIHKEIALSVDLVLSTGDNFHHTHNEIC